MTTASDYRDRAQALVDFILTGIPLARDMQLRLRGYDGERFAIAAPLPPNVNDKGCAFGGSLVSLMTLCGWGLVELALRARGEDCDVFVGESQVRYLAPVWEDFHAEATLTQTADWTPFFETLASRGKARIEVDCSVPAADGKPAATLQANFVAKRRA